LINTEWSIQEIYHPCLFSYWRRWIGASNAVKTAQNPVIRTYGILKRSITESIKYEGSAVSYWALGIGFYYFSAGWGTYKWLNGRSWIVVENWIYIMERHRLNIKY